MRKLMSIQLNPNASKSMIIDLDALVCQQMKNFVRHHGLPVVINTKATRYDGSNQLTYTIMYYDQFEAIKSLVANNRLVDSVRMI